VREILCGTYYGLGRFRDNREVLRRADDSEDPADEITVTPLGWVERRGVAVAP
jgi:hypothetical protein